MGRDGWMDGWMKDLKRAELKTFEKSPVEVHRLVVEENKTVQGGFIFMQLSRRR